VASKVGTDETDVAGDDLEEEEETSGEVYEYHVEVLYSFVTFIEEEERVVVVVEGAGRVERMRGGMTGGEREGEGREK